MHFFENFVSGFLLEFRESIGSFIRRHFLDDPGRDFRLERFEDTRLHFGIDLGERFGGDFAVDGANDRLAFGGPQFLDDVREVGRVKAFELLV